MGFTRWNAASRALGATAVAPGGTASGSPARRTMSWRRLSRRTPRWDEGRCWGSMAQKYSRRTSHPASACSTAFK